MGWDRTDQVLTVAIVVALVVMLGLLSGVLPIPWSQDQTTVEVLGDRGDQKADIEVEVADTPMERYTGLGDHGSLAHGEGMLFVHASERERTYVMRDMDFDIDMVFIAADGTITTIHHARAPAPHEDGSDLEYTGRGKWVLEVPGGYVNATGIEEGNTVIIAGD